MAALGKGRPPPDRRSRLREKSRKEFTAEVRRKRILREDKATSYIPVVALSANAIPRDIQKGLEAGFFRYLTKPIKVSEFMDALNVALEYAEESHAHIQ